MHIKSAGLIVQSVVTLSFYTLHSHDRALYLLYEFTRCSYNNNTYPVEETARWR